MQRQELELLLDSRRLIGADDHRTGEALAGLGRDPHLILATLHRLGNGEKILGVTVLLTDRACHLNKILNSSLQYPLTFVLLLL